MKYSKEFLKEIPKNDLHLHLDGSLRPKTLIHMAKSMKIELPSYEEQGLYDLVFKENYANLGEYLNGFKYTCDVMRDLLNIEQISYELAKDCQAENVNYIEIRFAPQLLVDHSKGLTFEKILIATNNGLEKAKKEYNNSDLVKVEGRPEFHYGIINCAMRMFGPKGFSPYYTQLFNLMEYAKPMQVITQAAMEMVRASVKLRDEKDIPIVGIDLAGQESGYPAGKFKEV